MLSLLNYKTLQKAYMQNNVVIIIVVDTLEDPNCLQFSMLAAILDTILKFECFPTGYYQ